MALTQNDLQAINGLLIPIREDIKNLKGDVESLSQGQKQLATTVNRIATTIDAIAEGQKDIRGKVVKELKNHERRITDLEEDTHSHKN